MTVFSKKYFTFLSAIPLLLAAGSANAVTSIPFTINMSEPVTVTGTPRIAMNVGGKTRYATYDSGSGTSTLTFAYTMTSGDLDLNGITLSSPVDLNGGALKDLNGNDATLTFTPPNTTNVKVNYPSLSMDFVYDADGRYILNGTAHDTLSSFLTASGGTFARSSIGTYYDSTGTLQIAASGSPRFDYDPSNSNAPRGLLIEESRTNQLKNSQFTGAAIGVSPSNVIVSPGGSGITASITAVGTTNGENYMEVMFSGTSTAGGTIYPNVFFTPAAADLVPAAQGQAWTGRIHIISDTGTSPNNLQVQLAELTSGNVYLDASNVNTTGGAYLTVTRTLTNASTAYIRFIILTSLAPGQSINRTIRFSVPQLERGAFATSYIPTTGSTVTRSADSLTLPPSTWFNGTTGTWYASFDGGRESNQGYYGRVVSPDSSYTALSTDGGNTLTVGTWTGGTASRITTTTDFYTTAGKAALGYDQTTLTRSISARGLTPVTTSYTGTYNATSGTIGIGRNAASTTNMLNGHIQSLKFYPLRADDTQLQLLTQ